MRLLTQSSSMTVDDYIEKSLGNLRSQYYLYLDAYHQKPYDLIDMVDGILFLDCKQYVQEKARQEVEDGQVA